MTSIAYIPARSEELYWEPQKRTKRSGRDYWVVILTGHRPPLDTHATIGTRSGDTKEFKTEAAAITAADEMNVEWQALFNEKAPDAKAEGS